MSSFECSPFGGDFILSINDSKLEFDFFKILVLSVIVGWPRFFIDKLIQKDPKEMYKRAKS